MHLGGIDYLFYALSMAAGKEDETARIKRQRWRSPREDINLMEVLFYWLVEANYSLVVPGEDGLVERLKFPPSKIGRNQKKLGLRDVTSERTYQQLLGNTCKHLGTIFLGWRSYLRCGLRSRLCGTRRRRRRFPCGRFEI